MNTPPAPQGGTAHIVLTASLTAKDGLGPVELEPLPSAAPEEAAYQRGKRAGYAKGFRAGRSSQPNPDAVLSSAPGQGAERDPHFGGNSYDAFLLRELLAVIHRDGGHYVAEHGIEKAAADAQAKFLAAPPLAGDAPPAAQPSVVDAAWVRSKMSSLAGVAFDAGIKHGRGAKNFWDSDGKGSAIIAEVMAHLSTAGAERGKL